MRSSTLRLVISATALAGLSTFAYANSGSVAQNPLKNVYYGETHMHTAYSLDAFIGGNRQTPSDAYRVAKGETVSVNGLPHKLRRPLDFAAVTDHAEYIGGNVFGTARGRAWLRPGSTQATSSTVGTGRENRMVF